jgi:hypothetical protein
MPIITHERLREIICEDGDECGLIPRPTKFALAGLIGSCVSLVIGGLSFGLGFLPPPMALSIMALGVIGFVACLVFIIAKREKTTPSSHRTSGFSPIDRTDNKEASLPEDVHISVDHNYRDGNVHINVGTRKHPFGIIEISPTDDGTKLLKKLRERFPNGLPPIELLVFSGEDVETLLLLSKIMPFATSFTACLGLEPNDNAKLAQLISSLSILRKIKITLMTTTNCASIPEEVLGAVENHPTLQEVSFLSAEDLRLKKMSPQIDSISFYDCKNINARSVLEGRMWENFGLNSSKSGNCSFSTDDMPERITTKTLETALGTISKNPRLLDRFPNVRMLVLKTNEFTGNEDMRGIFDALLQYGPLPEITLVVARKFDKFPGEFWEIIKQISQLKKLTILRERFRHDRYDEAIITDKIRETLLAANPDLEIVEKDSICDYGCGY